MKDPAAVLSASTRLVLSVEPIGSSIEPETSSTSTMSSGIDWVTVVLDVDDMTESVVKKFDWSSSPAASTVLSVQIRPTFWVESRDSSPPPAVQCFQRSRVSGSTVVVAAGPCAEVSSAMARIGAASASTPVRTKTHVSTYARVIRTAFFIGHHRFLCSECRPVYVERTERRFTAVVNIRPKNGQNTEGRFFFRWSRGVGQLSQTTDKSRGAAARVTAGSFAAPGRRRAGAMERSEKDARGLYDAQGHRGAAKMGAVARAVTKRAAVAQIRLPQQPFLSRSMPQRRFLPHGDQRRRFPPHSRHTPAPGPARNKKPPGPKARRRRFVVETKGFEPSTSGLQSPRSPS